jgi:hypothetical protein
MKELFVAPKIKKVTKEGLVKGMYRICYTKNKSGTNQGKNAVKYWKRRGVVAVRQ